MKSGTQLLPIEPLQSREPLTMLKHSLQKHQLKKEKTWLREPKKLNGTSLPFLNTTGKTSLQTLLNLQLPP
jgi:hypothetical protein